MKKNDAANKLLIQAIKQEREEIEYTSAPFAQSYYNNYRKNEQKIMRSAQVSAQAYYGANEIWLN